MTNNYILGFASPCIIINLRSCCIFLVDSVEIIRTFRVMLLVYSDSFMFSYLCCWNHDAEPAWSIFIKTASFNKISNNSIRSYMEMCYKEEHIELKKEHFCPHDVISLTIKIQISISIRFLINKKILVANIDTKQRRTVLCNDSATQSCHTTLFAY